MTGDRVYLKFYIKEHIKIICLLMNDKSTDDAMSEADYNSLLAEVKRWRTVEELSDIIWEVNMNLKFIYISPSVEKLIGFTQKEMMKKSMNDLFTSESVSLIEKTLAEGMEREAADTIREIPPPIEVEAKHRDGTSIWLELSRVFVRNEEDIPIGVLGVARDISDRVRSSIALQESESKYRALAERTVLGIAIAQDNPVRLSYVNDMMEEILGYSKEELMGLRGEETAKLIYPEDHSIFFETFRDRIENRPTPNTFEFRAVRNNSEVIWLEVHGTRMEYQSKPAILATFIDITEEHRARKEVEEERNFAEFLIDLMSHDLNNIHQGMMTALELMSIQKNITTETRLLLENSFSQLSRAGGLISKVKTLSDVKSKTMQRIRIDIYEPISKAIESIRKTFPQREVSVDFRIKQGTHYVWGCRFILDVFYNLLHNAVKVDVHEPVLLDIHVKPVPDGTSLQISVEDRGPGIPDSMKRNILTRVGDGKTTRSGIGLTLVQQIIDRCQGKIWIEDRVKGDHSKGAKFVILLQLAHE